MSLAPFADPALVERQLAGPGPGRATVRRLLACTLAVVMLGGCATRHDTKPTAGALLRDELFTAPAEPVDASHVFELSAPMRSFADATRAAARGPVDLRYALLNALSARDQLRLEYDDGRTRNAAEAFDKRAGNCLSLVLMTAAFAKYLDLPVRYQSVQVRPLYSRASDLMLASGHINVVLSSRHYARQRDLVRSYEMTVDFVPPEDLRNVISQPLNERTVVAMYMNNRAAETLAAGDFAQAYAWAREALSQDPDYLPGINTLAVVYLRSGHAAEAEAALRHVLAQAPEDEAALSNLAGVLRHVGRNSEAAAVAAQLARLQPYPPFHFLDLGRQALAAGQAEQARELIARELRRQPFQHEAHYWAAVVDATLGDAAAAEQHLQLAQDYSGSPQLQARYSAKLATLRAAGMH